MKKNIALSPKIETLFGTRDENLHLLEDGLNVSIDLKSDSVEIEGTPSDVSRAEQVFADYAHLQRNGFAFYNGDLGSMLRIVISDPNASLRTLAEASKQRAVGKRSVQPKSVNQKRYIEAIENDDMVFGIGPAGTGKTYLAVAMAVSALVAKQVNRIILARPAVEAGERLGFLPGTLQEKVDPYLRPLYDALYDLLDAENMGFNSKCVITGDITQIELPNTRRSGLLEVMDVLKSVNGISFIHFDESDVVRHHLVQRIVRAYEDHKVRTAQNQLSLSLESQPAEASAAEEHQLEN